MSTETDIAAPEMVNATQAALLWSRATNKSMSRARLSELCRLGRVTGAKKVGKTWMIPTPVEIKIYDEGRPRKSEGADE